MKEAVVKKDWCPHKPAPLLNNTYAAQKKIHFLNMTEYFINEENKVILVQTNYYKWQYKNTNTQKKYKHKHLGSFPWLVSLESRTVLW